ncbi:MAG: prepilin-type N-terminal cleavage/methylation domain-containing protein [Clostridiaceae bacterium]|nr:prepilin-type N-terminal cleavage/methylation domain-containing protein [Clostridiaceae bacterium]
MKKKKYRNEAGVTLIEIIIVLAIIGVLASAAVLLIGHLHYADTERVIKNIDTSMNELQIKNISKAEQSYLYIYHLSDGYYMRILSDDLSSFDSGKLNGDGTKLSNNTIEIYGTDAGGSMVTIKGTANYIKVSYTKSGSFDSNKTNVKEIAIDGTPQQTLTLIFDTGKHFIS